MNLSESIRQTQLTESEKNSIAESRAVLQKCGETLWALRPFDPTHKDFAPCYDSWCTAGDAFRADPTPEKAAVVITAKKAMDEAGANQRALREVLQPTIDSHHDRLSKVAISILDRVVAELEEGFAKRRQHLNKQATPTSTAEISGLDQALHGIRQHAERMRETLAIPHEGNPWLEMHDF